MDKLIDDLIKLAFAEDIGDGDHTTLCCIPETAMGKSQLIIKEDGVLAGVEMAKLPPTEHKGSNFSTSSPAFDILFLFYYI